MHDVTSGADAEGPWEHRPAREGYVDGWNTWRRPYQRIEEGAVGGDLEEPAPVEFQQLTDAAQATAHRLDHLIVGQVDQLKRQIGDELFELEVRLERGLRRVLHGVSRAHFTLLTVASRTTSPA